MTMTFPHSFRNGLVALAYAIAPSSATAQEKDICQDPASSWSLPYLARLTKLVDGYQGWSKHPRDGKLGLSEYADHHYGELCRYQTGDVEVCAGRKIPAKPKGTDNDWGDTMSQRFAEVAMAYTMLNEEKWLKPFDANRDGYLTPADDIDGDGFITCADAQKYVPPVKVVKPTKNQPPQLPKTPRRR